MLYRGGHRKVPAAFVFGLFTGGEARLLSQEARDGTICSLRHERNERLIQDVLPKPSEFIRAADGNFVSGHEFIRAAPSPKSSRALAPVGP